MRTQQTLAARPKAPVKPIEWSPKSGLEGLFGNVPSGSFTNDQQGNIYFTSQDGRVERFGAAQGMYTPGETAKSVATPDLQNPNPEMSFHRQQVIEKFGTDPFRGMDDQGLNPEERKVATGYEKAFGQPLNLPMQEVPSEFGVKTGQYRFGGASPEGFSHVGGKFMKNPAYINPLSLARFRAEYGYDPSQPKPEKPQIAPQQNAPKVAMQKQTNFNSVEEALGAGLPKGTVIMVQGRRARID